MEHSQSTGAGPLLAGRYRLSESIGRGGMGKVWRAQDEVLHRTVAVKELTAGRFVSEADRAVLHARTQKEARAAARITHPGVVTVHDVLEHDDRPWIVMQYVDGPSLADAMKESTPDAREAARIGLHVLGALRAAHAAGVLHRDVKPGNVLLARDGRVLLTDFGIAAIEGDSTITRTGELVGSIDYLAPERVRGGAPGPSSDLWSLGATLYAAVQGVSPFRRDSPITTMQAVVTEEPVFPDKAGALAPVITALLRKDPEGRPSADAAERMLLEAMEGRTPKAAQAFVPTQRVEAAQLDSVVTLQQPVPSTADSPVTTTSTSSGGGRWRAAVVAAVVAGLVAGAAVFAVMTYGNGANGDDRDKQGRGPGPSAGATTTPGKEKGTGDEVVDPAGWRRVKDEEGFSISVPKGWKRQINHGGQIDYTPDNGRHLLRISIDRQPDFETPLLHAKDLEKQLRKRFGYKRERLTQNTFRDQQYACLLEFSWTERQNHPGPRRAIDQFYYGDDGTEYAIYMSSPAGEWDETRRQFDHMLKSWQPPSD
ncbi:serine/threonine-protein kinase [Streptomyces sp. HUAS MG47]|uniref:serine/threonine-protein kinase n=1 Tax=Streptomyces solicamelliae TaxID=3231716 RepID=UPI003877E62C